MMYMVIEYVREWLGENNVKGDDGSAWATMMKRQKAEKKKDEEETQEFEEQVEKMKITETEERERGEAKRGAKDSWSEATAKALYRLPT